LFVAVGFTCLFSLLLTIALFIKDRKNGIPRDKTNIKSVLYSSLLLGAVMGTANKLNTHLAGVFSSVITFPVVNGGRILLTTVLGAILFREKTNFRQKLGILCGFIAILFIAI
jgi:drug/metabolite transporter (DMT)-like permease